MNFKQGSKRVGLSCAIGFTMLVLCLIAYNAQSSCKPASGMHPVKATTRPPRASRAGSGQHPKPWLKIVFLHAISIANQLAA